MKQTGSIDTHAPAAQTMIREIEIIMFYLFTYSHQINHHGDFPLNQVSCSFVSSSLRLSEI